MYVVFPLLHHSCIFQYIMNAFRTLSSKLLIRCYGDCMQCERLLWKSSRQNWAFCIRTWGHLPYVVIGREFSSPSFLLQDISLPTQESQKVFQTALLALLFSDSSVSEKSIQVPWEMYWRVPSQKTEEIIQVGHDGDRNGFKTFRK